MAYLTYSEFQQYHTGVEMEESEFATLSFYAESAISSYINSPVTVDETIKRAAAIQITLSYNSGGAAYYTEISAFSEITSEHLGDYSYSKSIKGTETQSKTGLFPIVQNMLAAYKGGLQPIKVIL